MSTDWRELLDRFLDGEELTDAEVGILTQALKEGSNRAEGTDWVWFAEALKAGLGSRSAEEVSRSRERLIAKAVLQEKRVAHGAAAPRHARTWRRTAVAAAVLVVAVMTAWMLFKSQPYPQPRAEGDVRVVRDGSEVRATSPLERGDRVIAGPNGAQLKVGGYCDLTLEPKAEIVLRGAPGSEAVELETGDVRSKVTPGRGGFSMLTPIGSLRVIGTEFTTSVQRNDAAAQKPPMGEPRSIHSAAEGGSAEVVKTLLAAGTDVNARDENGATPLLSAASYGRLQVVKLLLERGADVRAASRDGRTALHCVVTGMTNAIPPSEEREQEYLDTLEALVAAGAEVNARDVQKCTPLNYAARMHDYWRGRAPLRARMARALIKHGADVNARDENNYTPLYWAAKHYGQTRTDPDTVLVLVEGGADPLLETRPDDIGPGSERPVDLVKADAKDPVYVAMREKAGPRIAAEEKSVRTAFQSFLDAVLRNQPDLVKAAAIEGLKIRGGGWESVLAKEMRKDYAAEPERLRKIVDVKTRGDWAVATILRPGVEKDKYMLFGLLRRPDGRWGIVDFTQTSRDDIEAFLNSYAGSYQGERQRLYNASSVAPANRNPEKALHDESNALEIGILPADAKRTDTGPPTWVTILPKSPIRLLSEYHHTLRTNPPGEPPLYKPTPVPVCDFEIRRAADQSRVARVPYAGYFRDNQELHREDLRRIGELPDGRYLVALYAGNDRCSNVAPLQIDSKFDPKTAPTLEVVPQPLGPGQKLPYVGLIATGPNPLDPKLRNDTASFPTLIVDGVERKLTVMVWAGPVAPLQPGQRHQILLDLSLYKPEIAQKPQYRIKARVLNYESAEVVIPADNSLDVAWDKATAGLEPLAPPTVSLQGTVTGWDGKPGAAYEVSLTIPNRDNFRVTCDKDGHYAFVNIPPGEYELFTTRPVYGRGLAVKKVIIEAGKTGTLDLSLESRFHLSGKVTYADGAPAFGQTVDASWDSPDGTMEFYDCAETDAKGRYSIGSPFEMVSWTWVMPNLDQKRKIRAADGVDFLIERPWGYAVEGVDVRLKAPKSTWKFGEVVTLSAEIRNQGKRELSVAQAQQLAEVEVDGARYRWGGDVAVKSSAFPPGRHYEDIALTLDEHWQGKDDAKPLKLAPGTHHIRVAFTAVWGGGRIAGAMPPPVRAISNPVVIEILPADAAKPAAAGRTDARSPVTVTVTVASGVVAYDFGGETGKLVAGETRTFGEAPIIPRIINERPVFPTP